VYDLARVRRDLATSVVETSLPPPLRRVLQASACALVRQMFATDDAKAPDGVKDGVSMDSPPTVLLHAVTALSKDIASTAATPQSTLPLPGGLSRHPHGPEGRMIHVVCLPANLDVSLAPVRFMHPPLCYFPFTSRAPSVVSLSCHFAPPLLL
jgi:hypothetical protein